MRQDNRTTCIEDNAPSIPDHFPPVSAPPACQWPGSSAPAAQSAGRSLQNTPRPEGGWSSS